MQKTKSQIHYNMSRIRGKDTSIETKLRKELFHNGIRYRKNVSGLSGHPDIVISKYRIIIFCDGDFFHGYDLGKIESQLKTNTAFWMEKIERNQERDRKNDLKLVNQGYVVLHFWEHEIKEDIQAVLDEIYACIEKQKIILKLD